MFLAWMHEISLIIVGWYCLNGFECSVFININCSKIFGHMNDITLAAKNEIRQSVKSYTSNILKYAEKYLISILK